MCLLALAWRVDERWPLVLAANRDERYDRPSLPIHRWEDAPEVLGGQDGEFGGTWLGVSEAGRLAAITNVRNPAGPPRPGRSRGLLTRALLTGELDLEGLEGVGLSGFNPFNLVAVQGGEAVFATNRPGPGVFPLTPGFYAVSNGEIGAPWPKTEQLKRVLTGWLRSEDVDYEPLFAALADDAVADDAALPDTGVGLERERLLSAAFIRGEVYGTRASTIVRIAADGSGELAERTFGPMGAPIGESFLEFRWPEA
jgi:uncharacterized protein with NRDE domain